MDAERWQRVAEVFERAVALPANDRAEFLGKTCGDDVELRVEVQKLLANDATKTDHFLQAAAIDGRNVQSKQPSSRIIAPEIEGYEIVRELHRGGQGIVYQAVQKVTRRKVAIKVLLEGPYASDKARRRFEREIELVASLKHPNIISIFHSGQTSAGHQFCAMDYVRGVPLNRYVQDQKLSLEDALQLFAKVCDAVNYAHQKGVIHRDLKPSNILVDSVTLQPSAMRWGPRN